MTFQMVCIKALEKQRLKRALTENDQTYDPIIARILLL